MNIPYIFWGIKLFKRYLALSTSLILLLSGCGVTNQNQTKDQKSIQKIDSENENIDNAQNKKLAERSKSYSKYESELTTDEEFT